MKKLLPIIGLLILSGCATTKTMYASDGKPMIAVECHGTMLSESACFEKAGEICNTKGYSIIGKNGEAIPFSTEYGQSNFYANSQGNKNGYNSSAAGNAVVTQQSGMIVFRTLYIRYNP